MDKKVLRSNVHKELMTFYSEFNFDFIKKMATFKRGEVEVFWGVAAKRLEHIFFTPDLIINNIEITNVLDKLFPDRVNTTFVKVQCRDLAREFNCYDYDHYASENDIDLGAYYSVDESTDLKKNSDGS